jgi:hypothetical protein
MLRKGGEWSFECSYSRGYIPTFPHPSFRKLEGVIAKLEPLSEQHALVRFLRNIDIAKTLGGFVQELADAITDYHVRVAGLTVALTERPARFRCNKECTRGRGKFMTIPKMSTARPGKSGTIPRTSIVIPRTSATTPRTSTMIPRTSAAIPRTSLIIPRTSLVIPRTS